MSRFPGPSVAAASWLVYFHLPFLLAVNIGDVLNVKGGTTGGGCDNYATQLNQFWEDSQKLATAGTTAYTDAASGNGVALATLVGYFGINTGTSDAGYAPTKSYMDQINTFFQGGTSFEGGLKPLLFCDSDWLTEYSRTDIAMDDKGQTWPFDDDGNLHPPAIQDIQEYYEYLYLADGTPSTNVPYWSPDLNDYIFDIPSDGNSYCSNKKNLGATQTDTVPHTVTLCMANIINNKPARDAVLGTTAATVNKFVKTLVPQAATLFHEAFHLVIGTPETPDAAYALTSIQSVIRDMSQLSLVPATTDLDNPNAQDAPDNDENLTKKQLIGRNPETYIFFSTAYWQYQNSGKTVTLATGQVKNIT